MNLIYIKYVNFVYTLQTQKGLQASKYNSKHKRSVLMLDKMLYAFQQYLNRKERHGDVSSSGRQHPDRRGRFGGDVAITGTGKAKLSLLRFKYCVAHIVLMTNALIWSGKFDESTEQIKIYHNVIYIYIYI